MSKSSQTTPPGVGSPTQVPGVDADSPAEVPAAGWKDILKRAAKEVSADQLPLLSAGVAFYGFLALFPTLIAAVLLYGLVSDPTTITDQIDRLSGVVPADAIDLIRPQMESLVATDQQGLGIGLVIALATAMWSASTGVSFMMTALNVAYDEKDDRGFLKKRAVALLLTLGAIVVFIVMVALIAVFPAVFGDQEGIVGLLLQAVRWVLLLATFTVALGVLYRRAPDRDSPKIRWASPGAVVATVIWLLASIGFSFYASFGGYQQTYGVLAGFVVLMMWLWLSCLAILIGAELNAESEQQTARDSTVGAPRPLGQRDAVKADTLPGDPQPGRATG